jgi:hypothetical protein
VRTRNAILLVIAVIVVCILSVVGFSTYDAWHRFAVEDEIHLTFYPLANALYQYEEDHKTAATNLVQLALKYISIIPTSRLVSAIDYTATDDGKVWQLSLRSRALKPPRVYCCRSSQEYTEEEKKRILRRYHSLWTVLIDR